MCPLLPNRLWKLLKVVWRKGEVTEAWKEAEGIFTPKERNSKTVNQFRTISLLNVEGKLFFAVLARRLTSFLTDNAYIDTSVQKEGIPGFSGCVEHTSAITQLILETKYAKKDLTVVWLNLVNAYGSIHNPATLPHWPSHPEDYHQLSGYNQAPVQRWWPDDKLAEVGERHCHMMYCTVSMVLFIMKLLINSPKRETREPRTQSGRFYGPLNIDNLKSHTR